MALDPQRKHKPSVAPPPDPIVSRHKMFSPRMLELNRLIKKDGGISHTKAGYIDQGTMNSFCRREFLVRTRDGYVPTDKWFRVIAETEHAEIVKDHESKELGKYVRMLATVRSMRGAA